MSKKRMMSKQQRLYYEQNKKERVREELVEYIKDKHLIEKNKPDDGLAKNILYWGFKWIRMYSLIIL